MNIRLLRRPPCIYPWHITVARVNTQQLPIRNQKASGDWGECNICEAEFIFQSMRNKLKNENTEH